jgi:hypothetical protein
VNRLLGLVLAAALAVGVVVAVGYSVASKLQSQPLVGVHGVIGSEKQDFFQDPEVRSVFRRHGLDVQVDTAGSREMATTVDLSRYDFAFPAGVPAAQKIKTDHRVATTYGAALWRRPTGARPCPRCGRTRASPARSWSSCPSPAAWTSSTGC